MPYIITENIKTRQASPFRGQLQEREIVVEAGAIWPTGVGKDEVIPLGVPMSVVTASTNNRYKPIRRTTLAAAGAATIALTVNCADGFATGDIIEMLGSADYVAKTAATVASVDYTNEIIYLTVANAVTGITGDYVEVTENGYSANIGGAVFLAESVQTKLEGSNVPMPAKAYITGQVEVAGLEAISPNCYDALIEGTQISGFDYIPTAPGA